jgi:hypothetical protein
MPDTNPTDRSDTSEASAGVETPDELPSPAANHESEQSAPSVPLGTPPAVTPPDDDAFEQAANSIPDEGHDLAAQDVTDAEREARDALARLKRTCAYVERGGFSGYATEMTEQFAMQIGPDHRMTTQLRCIRIVDGKTMAARYENQKITHNKKRVSIFAVWRAWPGRRQYDRVVYRYRDPVPARALNLATGWAVKPRAGVWTRMQEHIRQIVCRGDARLATWLLDYIADIFQNPDRKRSTCVVLVGQPGTGKTKLLEWIRWLVARAALKLDRSSQLIGRFNAHLEGKLVIAVEETAFTSGRIEAAVLKDLISSPTLTVEEKFGGIRECENKARIFVCTNDVHAVAVEPGDRRYMVLEVSAERARDYQYFRALDDEMANGGDAAMLYDLLNRKITSNLDDPPQTDSIARQKLFSLGHIEQAMLKVITTGVLYTRDGVLVITLPTGNETTPVDRALFDKALEDSAGAPKPTAQRLAAARRMFGIRDVRPTAEDGSRPRQYAICSAERMIESLGRSLKIEPSVICDFLDL